MSIRNNIERIMTQVQNGDIELGKKIQKLALAAIRSGVGTPEWEKFMRLFARKPEELSRLLATDATADKSKFDLARARLVANAVGGAETVGFRLIEGIGDTLDFDLSGDPTTEPDVD